MDTATPKSGARRCRACTAKVDKGRFLCEHCWKKLPEELRTRIVETAHALAILKSSAIGLARKQP